MKCVNYNCKNSSDTLNTIHIGYGSFVCSKECEQEYIKQTNEFLNNIHDDEYYNRWLKK
jgi:hypothetical protein